ncbi:MAG TPA: M1 family metallopeptidase, partial [Longimicrobiales bacterium]
RLFAVLLMTAPAVACASAPPPPPRQPVAVEGRPVTTGMQGSAIPERAVRRNIPMTNQIRRAHEAGTRDSTGRPGANYWQLRTDYTIRASLDEKASVLRGSETIVLRNGSRDTLGDIRMRLDQNIFRPHAYLASSWMPSEVTDGMVITSMKINGQPVSLTPPANAGRGGGAPTTPTMQGITMTNARLVLPASARIMPGASATLDIEWNFKVAGGPGGSGHRMTSRWADSLYQFTQWYPRVAVYDDLRGWDTEIYLGPSEFYNNFGRFDVSLDVPAGWIVGSTGELQNPEQVLTPTARERLARVTQSDSVTVIVGPTETGPGKSTANGTNGRLTWHFVADTVNDFAWGTAKQYVWQATRATIPGRGEIPVHMYFTPGNARLYTNAPELGRHALEFYSQLLVPYPFPKMSMIDGPSAGMEYPMVIMSNQGAADHEIAHSWWPMMVGNNETQYGWMDEGFNQYMNILSGADRQNQAPNLDGRGQSYGGVSGNEAEPPLMWSANYGGPMYSFQTYSKTPLMLSMLGAVVGDTAVQRALREYASAWKFKHPSPWDFMFSMNRSLNRDLGWFWYYWLFTTEASQGSIQNMTTTGTRSLVTVRQDGEMPAPVVLRVKLAATGAPIRTMANAVMEDANTAIVTYPVDVWFSGSRTFVADLDFGRAIESVTYDPFRRFPDRDATDNVWPR